MKCSGPFHPAPEKHSTVKVFLSRYINNRNLSIPMYLCTLSIYVYLSEECEVLSVFFFHINKSVSSLHKLEA